MKKPSSEKYDFGQAGIDRPAAAGGWRKPIWIATALGIAAGALVFLSQISTALHENRLPDSKQKSGAVQSVLRADMLPSARNQAPLHQGTGSASPARAETPFHAAWSPALEEICDSPEEERAGRIESFIAAIARADLPSAIDFFRQSQPSPVCGDIASGLLRRLAAADPAAAAANAEGVAGEGRARALGDVAVVWANADASAAAAWARGLPSEDERNAGLSAVAYEASRTDAVEALTLAVELPASDGRTALIDHAAAQWAAATPEKAIDWARRIPDADLRNRVLARAAVEWANQDPAASAAFAASQLPAGRLQDDTVISIVQRWTQADPAAAGKWIEQFPQGALRETAMENFKKLDPSSK